MLTLISIPFSHYCEKARWGLDHARLPFREEAHLPGFHRRASRRVGGGRTVPVLVSDEGVLSDSAEILRFCDRRAPAGRKLYPDPVADDVAALERRFGDKLGPHLRRLVFFHGLPDRPYMLRLPGGHVPSGQVRALRFGYPLLRAIVRRALRIDARGVARSEKVIDEIFAEVEVRMQDGRRFLTGDTFTAADMTFAALASVALFPPEHPRPLPSDGVPAGLAELRDRLRARPAGQFALRLYRELRRA